MTISESTFIRKLTPIEQSRGVGTPAIASQFPGQGFVSTAERLGLGFSYFRGVVCDAYEFVPIGHSEYVEITGRAVKEKRLTAEGVGEQKGISVF